VSFQALPFTALPFIAISWRKFQIRTFFQDTRGPGATTCAPLAYGVTLLKDVIAHIGHQPTKPLSTARGSITISKYNYQVRNQHSWLLTQKKLYQDFICASCRWRKRLTPVRRRLSRTHIVLRRVIPGGWMPVPRMKVRSLVRLFNHAAFHRWSAQSVALLLLSG